MQQFSFTATITGSAQQLSTIAIAAGKVLPGNVLYSPSYLPACKLFLQIKPASTGLAYVGPSTVTSGGVNAAETLDPATAPASGGNLLLESQNDTNTIDLAQYYLHGSVPGDTVSVVYHQN